MNVSRVLILVVALVAGGGAFYLATSGGGAPAPQPGPEPQEVAMTKVLFARSNLEQGTVITQDKTKWVEWPEKTVPDFYVTDKDTDFIEGLGDMRARIDIFSNEPIFSRNTVRRGDRGMMAAIMTPGMRAVSAKIKVEQVSGGFILPGDRVDVFASRDKRGQVREAPTNIVLSNVRVLAIDQTFTTEDDDIALPGKTITLEVAPSMVETFIEAKQSADLTIVLRSVFDEDIEDQATPTPDQVVVIRYGQG